MSNSNYKQLSQTELRKYIKSHPQDEDAFQYYLSIIRKKPNSVVVSTDEQLKAELRKRLNS
ncbi:MAG: hypothetical protein AB4368_03005 [Xenococcaceae cyanobacterium]